MRPLISVIILAAFIIMGLIWNNQSTPVAEAMNQTAQQAAQAYEAENFAEAAKNYEQLVTAGVKNSDVFYNLGNSYFKQGDLGRAILNYQRAKQLAPRDGDIQTNLALAEQQTKDQLDLTSESTLTRIAEMSQNGVTLNELATIALILWLSLTLLLFGLSQIQAERWHEITQYTAIAVGLCFIITTFVLGSRLYVQATQPAAIIIADRVDVSSGPGTQFVTQFTLHSGTRVHVLEARDTWVRLTLPGDKMQGWVRQDTLAKVE